MNSLRDRSARATTSMSLPGQTSLHCLLIFAALITALLAPPPSWAQTGTASVKQATFPSPQLAASALIAAARSGGEADLLSVLGPDARRIISSGDKSLDKATRERFLAETEKGLYYTETAPGRTSVLLGPDRFPFPIPLVQTGQGWRFDTRAGEDEIIARRIGKNELSVIDTMHAYVEAQRDYASADRDGSGNQYAQRLTSSPGKKDGLYWPAREGEEESPLGPLLAGATSDGFRPEAGKQEPFRGYIFRILKSQGPNAPGGPQSYVIGGRMLGGFALIASPAKYGNSGVMSFIVNHDGIVFQKDLGPDGLEAASRITTFDPDPRWIKLPAH